MTQSYSAPIALQVASTQIPEAVAAVTITLSHQQESATNQLLLHPGQQSQISVYLENLSDRPLRWHLEIKGDFPADWCAWQPDTIPLNPGEKLDRTVGFQVSSDFFESSLALTEGRSSLQLDYQCEVYVYVQPAVEVAVEAMPPHQLVGYQIITLHVRPPNTYLNFLPALYREVDFVSRFLAIIEQAFDPTVQVMDQLWAYLDPLTAPEALLPFLANWVGWTTDAHWNNQQQRRLIRHAVTLYRCHGTRRGLRFYLHLYTGLPLDDHLAEADKHISIEEIFSDGFVLGSTAIGQDSMLGGGQPYHFEVRLRCDRPEQVAEIDEALVRHIIEQQKPAFCTYSLQILVLVGDQFIQSSSRSQEY